MWPLSDKLTAPNLSFAASPSMSLPSCCQVGAPVVGAPVVGAPVGKAVVAPVGVAVG